MIRLTAMTLLVTLMFAPVLIAGAGAPRVAWAQEAVNVRTGEHDNYTRLVFDWLAATEYRLVRDRPGQVEIHFDAVATLNPRGLGVGPASNVRSLRALSESGAPLAVQVEIPAGSDVRDFIIGNRVVLDIGNPPQGDIRQAAAPAAAPAPAPRPAPEPSPAPASPPPAPAPAPIAVAPAPSDRTVLQQVIDERLEPHVFTISATQSMGLAVFERGGWLWMVSDRPDLGVTPQVSGPQPGLFGAVQTVESANGSAYRVRLPRDRVQSDIYVYGEGGGLVWRVVVTPNERDVQPAPFERLFTADDPVRGGTAFWAMPDAARIIELTDPAAGDRLKVVTARQAQAFSGPPYDFVDFAVLPSSVGMAVMPKVDDLQVRIDNTGVQVTRPGGLALSRVRDISHSIIRTELQRPDDTGEGDARRLFNIDRWTMGGRRAFLENQTILLTNTAAKPAEQRAEDLLTLAKMNIANDRGQEAVGLLALASDIAPFILDSPEFIALRGVSHALAGQFELAFRDLQMPPLRDYKDLDFWRAYTLGWLEDWQQAGDVMPDDPSLLMQYPQPLQERMIVKLAEAALRRGNVRNANQLMDMLSNPSRPLKPWTQAGVAYLTGEARRQGGDIDGAVAAWQPLLRSRDDFYRVRAGLALTMLELERGDTELAHAIDRLEGLRYSWRGDELEAQINFMLGRLYMRDRQYLKGLAILRDAAGMSPDSDIGRDITAYMAREFNDLMMYDDDLSPLDAVMVYEEFRELTPPGDAGNQLVYKLAERLVDTDLLGRAANLLQHQVDYRISGREKADVAMRLATIALLDFNPELAMQALDITEDYYAAQPASDERAKLMRDLTLLRVRALSQMDRTEEAVEILNRMPLEPDVTRLRADIAWQAGLWDDAADALQDLIFDEAISGNRLLTEYQADLILNRAVALNLSGNRVALANMRQRYADRMEETSRGGMFELVTRPHSLSLMAERQTIERLVSEVDLFSEFLQNYRTVTEAGEQLTPERR